MLILSLYTSDISNIINTKIYKELNEQKYSYTESLMIIIVYEQSRHLFKTKMWSGLVRTWSGFYSIIKILFICNNKRL